MGHSWFLFDSELFRDTLLGFERSLYCIELISVDYRSELATKRQCLHLVIDLKVLHFWVDWTIKEVGLDSFPNARLIVLPKADIVTEPFCHCLQLSFSIHVVLAAQI